MENGNGIQNPTFGVYRPESRNTESGGTPGSAGLDSGAIKMLSSIRRVIQILSGDIQESLDPGFLESLEIAQVGSFVSIRALIQRSDALERLASKAEERGEPERALRFAEAALMAQGRLHLVCHDLYVMAGGAPSSPLVIRGEVGSFGSALLTEEGGVELLEGEEYALPPEGEGTIRRRMCRLALEREREIAAMLGG